MKPLIILMVIISGISFVYQNNITPNVQTRLWTLMHSIRTKNPELEIPVRSFHSDIPGYNMYVQHKDKSGLLREIWIYDHSKGFENLEVTVSDSGRMRTSDDRKYLILTLYNGESFQNRGGNNSRLNQNQTSFQRQTFSRREIVIEFDRNLNMADESIMRNREISKNIPALRTFIHEAGTENDSVTEVIRPGFVNQIYASSFIQERSYNDNYSSLTDTLPVMDFELLYNSLPIDQQIQVLDNAKARIERFSNEFNFRMFEQSNIRRQIRIHKIELHKKFSFSLACLLFFFIGAPLGAIIRKGGLGLPAVLSVTIFIIYFYVNMFGMKMAREDSWPIWQGMWLSVALLTLLGIFLTYKAVNDSVMINPDTWMETLLRLTGKREIRNYSCKEVIMDTPDYPEAIRLMELWNKDASAYLKHKQKIPFYILFWKQDFQDKQLNRLLISMDHWIEDLLNTDENLIIGKLMDYPVVAPYRLKFLNHRAVRWSCALLLPVGISIYIICFLKQKQINNDLLMTMRVNEEICKEVKKLKLNNNE